MDNNYTVQSYTLALLTLMSRPDRTSGQSDVDDQPLGMALRAETQSSRYHAPAHVLLQAVIQHSPSQEAVAQQFMIELANCRNNAVVTLGDALYTWYHIYIKYYLQVNSLEHDCSISPDDWAAAVHGELSQNGGDISHLTRLAFFYLNRLVIPCEVQCNICWRS